MKKAANFRFVLSLFLILSLFAPLAVLAGDGKKNFKEGMKSEAAEDWDKAAEYFALAVADNPKNTEYRLHYTRALFNASQMYMRKGAALASEKDYKGGYDAFRRAYAYDPTNELAKAEMERMSRLYREANGETIEPAKDDAKLVKSNYNRQNLPPNFVVPQKLEELENFGPFPGGVDRQTLIRDLARSLDLNVIFDAETFRNPTKILNLELKGVTAAKALDYIFLQENLFFQKIGPRTIMVANTQQRQKFQQLVLRTFYLANASPKDVENLIRTVIPAQPGRTPTIAIKDDATNSITIRDTAENIELMGQLIKSLDKDRAEVVMDVSIYEVSKSDLLKFGNQIGTEAQLSNLGGTTSGVVGIGGNDIFGSIGRTGAAIIPRIFGVGLTLPTANLQMFQNKQNTKLLASTQIHAFNNEDSSARIGQRVPVRTASISNGFNSGTTGGGTNNNNGFLSDVINYEQVGLTLKFKPLVFPNQDVQVAMEIESKDVVACATSTGNPCFSERTIKGTARVQNNKTLMLASVAQDSSADSRSGLPLLGLIPVLGRLFTAPSKDSRQVDIIIAVTPRVIRAPSILPEDEIERPTGSLAVPTNGSLEAMVIQEEIDEQLANARRLGNVAVVQMPDQNADNPQYVRSSVAEKPVEPTASVELKQTSSTNAVEIKPIDSSNLKTLQVAPTSDDSNGIVPKPVSLPIDEVMPTSTPEAKSNGPRADFQLLPAVNEMKAGEKTKIAVLVKSAGSFRSAVLGFKYDQSKIAVRSVAYGDVFGAAQSGKTATPFINQNGKTYVSLAPARSTADDTSGVIAIIEIEALTDGVQRIDFDQATMSLLSADGKSFAIGY